MALATLPKAKGVIRVVTYNVHMWLPPASRNLAGHNTESVLATLKALESDLVFCQEIFSTKDLGQVAEGLGFSCHRALAFRQFGNCVYSRWPVKDWWVSKLGIDRSVGFGVIDTPQGDLLAGTTHLDHLDEDTRLYQLREYFKWRDSTLPRGVEHLWMGDFNALRRKDYTDKHWKKIEEHRKQSRWEPPQTRLIDAVEADGYLDSWTLAGAEGPMPTCWADTRIDYIWQSPGFDKIWETVQCQRVESLASDHHPVVLDIRRRPDTGVGLALGSTTRYQSQDQEKKPSHDEETQNPATTARRSSKSPPKRGSG